MFAPFYLHSASACAISTAYYLISQTFFSQSVVEIKALLLINYLSALGDCILIPVPLQWSASRN